MKFGELVSGDKPVLVDFFAEWCGPCKMMTPILKDVKSEVGDSVKILKIDIDKNPLVARQYGIQSVPTMMIFKNGKPLWRQSGALPKHEVLKVIRQYS
jgi:thioredoxin 1